MNVAIIGAGNMAQSHSEAYLNIPGIKVVSVVDVSTENAEKIAWKHSASVYPTIEDMLDNVELDMVDICAPSFLHASMSIQCLDRGLHVLCEKPISNCLEDADKVIQKAEQANTVFMVGQILRFWPEYTYLKEAVEQKTYGALKHVSFSRFMSAPHGGWYRDPNLCGMVPYEVNIHDIDYIHYLMGVPKGVSSFAMENLSLSQSYIRSTLIYEDVLMDAEAGWSRSSYSFTACFRATFDEAVLEYKEGVLTAYPFHSQPKQIEFDFKVPGGSGANAVYNEILYFVHCVRDGTPPQVITPQDSRQSMYIVSKQLESSKLKEVVWL
jgi:predicted dehydrogenase